MNAKDLLTALNDIDPKLLEGIHPWGVPAQKVRRPHWAVAVAAALICCIGLGIGGTLLLGNGISTSSDQGTAQETAVGQTQDEAEVPVPDLEFAQNETGVSQGTGILYTEDVTQRSLTLEEMHYLRKQPGLSWMQDYYLTGNALFSPEGEVSLLMVCGYDPSMVDESLETFPVSETPAFVLALGQGEIPSNVKDQLAFLEKANNQVNGVDVWAAQFQNQETYIDPVSGERRSEDLTYYCTGYTLGKLGVGLIASADNTTISQEDAEHLAELAAGYGIYYNMGLDEISVEPMGDDTPNVNYGDSYHLIVLEPQAKDDAQSQGEAPTSTDAARKIVFAKNETDSMRFTSWAVGGEEDVLRELTQEEISSLTQQPSLAWAADYRLYGEATISPAGDVVRLHLMGDDKESEREIFSLYLQPGDLPSCQAQDVVFFLEEANNHIDGTDIWAAIGSNVRYYDSESDPDDSIEYHGSAYWTTYLDQSHNLGVALGIFSDLYGLSEEEAEEMAEQRTLQLLENPVTLPTLSQSASSGNTAAKSQSSAETPVVDLAFIPHAPEDTTFSDVFSIFTQTYLEPQNLASGGAKHDYELSEEEIASIWGGTLPWQDVLTENDSVLAYGYFSENGDLIKVFIGGYRDNPETITREKLQFFGVELYDFPLSGQWGQSVNEALALSETTVNGQDVATDQATSEVDYEDGTSATFHSYSAIFQPTSGPTLMEVNAFSSEWTLTEEQARSLANKLVEKSLYNDVSLQDVAAD